MLLSRILKIAAWIAGSAFALVVLLLAAVHTPPVRHLVLAKAIGLAADQGITLSASSLDYNLLGVRLDLRNVRVQSRATPDLPPVLTVDRVWAQIDLRRLLGGAFYLDDGGIENPHVHMVVDRDGRDNLPHPPPKGTKSSSSTDYLITHFWISGGDVRVEERRQQLDAFVPLDRLTINGQPSTHNHLIHLQTRRDGRVALAAHSMPLRALVGDLTLEKNAVEVTGLRTEFGESTVNLSGRMNSFDTPSFELRAQSTLALAPLVEFASQPPMVGGRINLAVTATGPLATLKATAHVNSADLSLERFDHVNLDAEAAYDAATSRVRLVSLSATTPWSRIRSQGDLALTLAAGESTARITAEGVDLERASAILKLPVRVASNANATVDAHWKALEFQAAAADASLQLTASRPMPAKDTIPVDASIHATVRGNQIVATLDSVRTFGATAAGQVTLVDRKSIAGDLRVDATHLSATVAEAEAFLGKPAGSLAGTPLEGALTSTATLGGTVDAPTAAVNLTVPDLSAGDLKDIAVSAAARYTPASLFLDSAQVGWQNQTVTASGVVGLGSPQTLKLSTQAPSLSIPSVLAGLNRSDLPVTGDASFAAEVTGTTDAPDAAVTLGGKGLVAYGQSLGNLDARATYRGDRLEVQDLRLGNLRATGSYNTSTHEYHADAHAQDFQISGLTLPGSEPPQIVQGSITLDASGQGTTENPAGQVRLAVDRLQVDDQQYGTITLSAQAANQSVDLEAGVPEYHVTATGRIGIQAPNAATLQVRLDQTDLTHLPVKLDQPVEGKVSAVIDASGTLADYQKGTAKAQISPLDVKWNGETIRSEGPLVAGYGNGTLTISQAILLAAGSRVEATGSLPLEASAGEGAIQLKARLDLAGLEHFLPPDKHYGLEGTASTEGSIRGTLRRLDPTLAIAIDGGGCATPEQGKACTTQTTLNLRAQVRDGALEIASATAHMGGASLQASGTIPFAILPADLPVELPRRQGPAKFTADLAKVDLATLPNMPENISGVVSAHIEAEAPKPDLPSLKASLTFPDLQATFDTHSVAQKGTSEITLENGVARVGHFQLTGSATEVSLSGTAELTGKQALDLHLDGALDASLASSFTTGLRARGATEIHAAVSGTVDQPQAAGYLQVADGQFSYDAPRIGIEGLNLRVDLAGASATLSKLEGQINGGTLSGKGKLEYANGKLAGTDLSIQADDLYLDFPAGLKTISDLQLGLRSVDDRLQVNGSVKVKEGGFTDDLYFDKGILAAALAPRSLDLTEQRNPLLESLRFNIAVLTQEPIAVQNNLAKAEIGFNLVVVGNPYETGLTGRLTIEEGSELTLQERKYEVSRGVITFTSDRRIEPTLDIEATTTASNYDITLQITGPPDDTKTQLTSSPVLPEPDIMAILVTGKTLDEIRGQEFQMAQTQVLSYLTGRVGAQVGHELEKATGLSRVRVEPNLIAAEANPGARLTVGQDITRQLNLVYSMDLVNSADQIYIAEYDLTKRFVTRGVRQADGTYRFDFRHDLRFGGIKEEKRKRQERHVGAVTINGDAYLTEPQIRKGLKVKEGQTYDFFKLRRGMDRVAGMYMKASLLESSVRLHRDQKDGVVNLNLKIDPGVKVDFAFEGVSVPSHVEKEVRKVWYAGVFDTQRVEDAGGVLRDWLVDQKHLSSKLTPAVTSPEAGRKHVVFDIQPGPKYEKVEWVFEGANGIPGKELRDIVESQKLTTAVYTKPTRVTELLTQYYREMGYLDAAIGNPAYALAPDTATGKVTFPVKEGPHYRVGEARYTGNTALTPAELAEAVPLPRGEVYKPTLRENSLQRLREAYWARGFNEVDTDAETERLPEQGIVNLTFHITENEKGVVQDVVVDGNRDTSEKMIRSQLDFKPGDPLNLTKVGASRRKLYNTGAYAVVDITREDVDGAAGAAPAVANTKLVRLRVHVQEIQPFEVRYGAFYDTERGPGGIIDFSNRNSLGAARVLGFRGRYDSQLQEARIYFSQPLLGRYPVKLIASPYVTRQINPETDLTSGFNVDRLGFSLQQEVTLSHKLLINYGYKIEKSRTYDTGPDPLFNVPLRLASLTATINRDTRDDVLDATRGTFISQAFQFSPEQLGSQVRYAKYFGQYFHYFPLQKPRVQLFTNKIIRPRLVYATAVRVGLARGFGGQEVPVSERFFAGGATTIRGFVQNSVGPATFAGGTSLGGVGMLILNNEMRFPIVSIFDGVGFVDLGNVYPSLSDFRPNDLRKAAGFGLRVRTPFLLLRMDYGINLQPRMGEPRTRLFFSIGQAF